MKTLFIAILAMASISAGAAENPAKQIKRQMCFETYPRTTFSNGVQHDWTINEVIETPGVYRTYKFIVGNKSKSDQNVMFDLDGISKQYDRTVSVSGSGFYDPENGWTLHVSGATKLGDRYSAENQTYAYSDATWDMYASIQTPGVSGGMTYFKNVEPYLVPPSVYEVSVVRAIDCKDFDRTAPALN